MKRTALTIAGALASALMACPAFAGDEFSIKLKTAPGSETTQNACAACHSLDYIVTNSPFQTQQVWSGEVNKMIKVFGADIPEPDAKAIIDYLAGNYGTATGAQ